MCSVLGDRPELWSKRAPLPVPSWFHDQLDLFSNAVHAASSGKTRQAIKQLAVVNSKGLRDWYVEHGQISGRFRTRIRQVPAPNPVSIEERDTNRSPHRYADLVFRRDGYRCRYCGLGVIPKTVLSAFAAVVGAAIFRATGSNAQRHGAVLAFRANADHVVPWKLGGRTNLENLVTACWTCNYGKAGYTVGQLGIDDPRNTDPRVNEWDGLSSLFPGLRSYAT